MFYSTACKFLVFIFLFVYNPISIFGLIKDTSLSHHEGKSLVSNAQDLDTAAFTFRKKKKKKKHHHVHHHHHTAHHHGWHHDHGHHDHGHHGHGHSLAGFW